ncbi:glycine cleavage system protein GcvH [Leptospira borgpetersenii]|uniref:Glycine cleavage system H protein n=4 Tax=Leptospira borgpetersenii TaxID=174 RepID=M3GU06_LEPBO|nr:glycine cleavage system protein GcvH [Leptospira borgpetersenii]EMF98313.1 glycine cleavage system H protein [Leptospira borgpetersenii str. 200701203]AXX16745.1 glycine cleavage system protein H [Leptospira borgpetersenii serovar Ceylonica]EKP12785.1 glycine cleavage system H protein [Leptospira borgpetersenii str. 200801926]EKQ93921.1 glycine cleavage system H protein [Leptospira borgpetersenii str. UI 09149]EMN12228.1 glycine cleavage system H protein [Leptospira borgpetersenii str. Brem
MAETQTPAGYLFSEKHEWVKVEGDTALIGISDFAQSALGDIVFVDLPKSGKTIKQFETFGTIESVKAAEDLYAPVGGEVIESNSALSKNPGDVNSKPFDSWMIKVKGFSTSELEKLLSPEKYKALVAKLE